MQATSTVQSFGRRTHAAAAGLLLWARRSGDIDRAPIPGTAQQHGVQQQMRAVSRCQLNSRKLNTDLLMPNVDIALARIVSLDYCAPHFTNTLTYLLACLRYVDSALRVLSFATYRFHF